MNHQNFSSMKHFEGIRFLTKFGFEAYKKLVGRCLWVQQSGLYKEFFCVTADFSKGMFPPIHLSEQGLTLQL